MNTPVFLVTPRRSLPVQIFQIDEAAPWQEVFLYKPDAAFHLALGLRTPNAAYPRDKPCCCREVGKQPMPPGLSVVPHAQDHRFH
jgi:hypothetical protein